MQNVVGLFETRADAEEAIQRLRRSGIQPEGISVAMKQTSEASGPDVAREPHLAEATATEDLAGEGTAVGAVSGAAVGTLVGLLVAGSTFVLPGLGTFLIAGPLFSALTGAGVGAASGGVLGALVGSGIPEEEASHYASDVESGRVILVARVEDRDAAAARVIFDEEGSLRTQSN